jgi:microcystin-dependent protein
MSDPFLSEIKIFSFDFPPKGWAFCSGQLLPINQNQALFALLGTNYGGNGRTTFALPDLRDRVPIHIGNGHVIGERGGEAAHTLTQAEMPTHTHLVNAANTTATDSSPTSNLVLAPSTPQNLYAQASNFVAMNPASITAVGGSQPHLNQQPFLTLNFCIALQGIFPSRN